jgi:hypothetical protein
MQHCDEQRRRLTRLRRPLALAAVLIVGAVCGVVCCRVTLWAFHLKRFGAVEEGVLYRSAQPTEVGLKVMVERLGIKTIASLRRENSAVRRNLFDFEVSGACEDAAVARLGARHLHWPMGGEAYWPWFGGEQFEQFFELMDDPGNFPVAVHCIGGRHRTGTFCALYRLEYCRWSVEDALREMYDFEFGHPVPIQEHNLRTYLPRPLPSDAEWAALQPAFAESPGQAADYAGLVRRLKQGRTQPSLDQPLEQRLRSYLDRNEPFALSLAQRVIAGPNDPLAAVACRQAIACLRRSDAGAGEWAVAAALTADFGDPAQQRELLDVLASEPREGVPSPRYQAIVRGVTNRYTPNRIAFLRPILNDERPRVEAEAVYQPRDVIVPYRYCDTAVARLATIVGLHGVVGPEHWEASRQSFLAWFAAHPEATRPARLGEVNGRFSRGPSCIVKDRDDYR